MLGVVLPCSTVTELGADMLKPKVVVLVLKDVISPVAADF
jgi:hypothetical protein